MNPSSSDNMTLRIARMIAPEFGVTLPNDISLVTPHSHLQFAVLEAARAMLTAALEPTEAMLDEGQCVDGRHSARQIWRLMVEAALSDEF